MELFFADDSGKDATKATYLIETAVSFDEVHMSALEDHIRGLRKKYGIPRRYELHWAQSTYKHQEGKHSVVGCRLNLQQHSALRRDFIGFLSQADATIIAAAIRHGTPKDLTSLMAVAIEYLAERAQMHLQSLYHVKGRNVLGLLIADEPGSAKENRQLMQKLFDLQSTGTRFISRFDNLASSVVYPSHLMPGIQLADFVAGAIDRSLNGQEEEWWSLLEPHFRRKSGTKARILGYGLVVRPTTSTLQVGSVTVR